MFFDRFFRKRDEAAELRDRALIAETQVLLLRDIVDHPPRRPVTREIRKDAGAYREEAAKRKAELQDYALTLTTPLTDKQREGRGA